MYSNYNMRFQVKINKEYSSPSIDLIDTVDNCKAEIFCFGGMLNSFLVTTNNQKLNVIDGYKNVEDAIENKNTWFKSCKLSPFVCRLENGRYSFEKQEYLIEKFYLNKHAIHGIIYDEIYTIEKTEATDNFALVKLFYEYQGTDKGYPFPFSIQLEWKLEKQNKLSVTTTVVNLSHQSIPYCEGWHPYFKLDTEIDNCTLQINATKKIEFNEELIPTGKLIRKNEFLKPIILKDKFLDDCFELSQESNEKCILKGKNIQLKIFTDYSYRFLQVFIPPGRKSIAIENLSAIPNAFNNKIGLQFLEPKREYQFRTQYQIEIDS